MKKIQLPMSEDTIKNLKAGEIVLLSGKIYTSRDAGHKRICQALDDKKELNFNLEGAVIYYVGPTPCKEGEVIGSAGPTTSGRMDAYAPKLIENGLKAMIGKGLRSQEVIKSMIKYNCVYFAAVGGIGALLSKCVKKSTVLDYAELESEALRELVVQDMPLVVAIDAKGTSIYEEGRKAYLSSVQ